VETVLFDLIPDNDVSSMWHPDNCDHATSLGYTPWTGHGFNSYNDSDGTPRSVDQMTPNGTAGTQTIDGRIIKVGPGEEVTILAEGIFAGPQYVNPTGIDVYPGFTPTTSGLSLFIQINSPVDVLITGPDGRRIGVDPNSGLPVNDYGDAGYDSQTNEPHIYGIRDPLPGDYAIATKGTGTGPYTITTYGANLGTQVITQASFTGSASPGSSVPLQFGLDQTGVVTVADADGDGYNDSIEAFVGTDTVDACPDVVGSPGLCPGPACDGDDAWPPDLDVDTHVFIADVLQYKGKLGKNVGAPGYIQRLNLNADGMVNIADVLKYKGILGQQCVNP